MLEIIDLDLIAVLKSLGLSLMKLDDEPVLVEEVGLEVKRYLSPEIFFI